MGLSYKAEYIKCVVNHTMVLEHEPETSLVPEKYQVVHNVFPPSTEHLLRRIICTGVRLA